MTKNVFNGWNGVVMAATSFLAVYMPLKLVGLLGDYSVFYWVANGIMVADIAVSLYQHYILEHDLIFQQRYEVKEYTSRWLWLDLLAAIPFGFIFPGSALSLLRLVKLIKVAGYLRDFRMREVRFANSLSLIFFAFWSAHGLHWLSCIWLYICNVQGGAEMMSNYIDALYWTTTTITTVGYGDIVPSTQAQKLFTIGLELLGVSFYGYLIGNIASVLARRDPAYTEYRESMDRLSAISKYRHLPMDIQNSVRDFYAYKWKNRYGYDEASFLTGFPHGLRRRVALHMKKEFLARIEVFGGADEEFLKDIALHLRPVIYTPGDEVFKMGDAGHIMYFVISGVLSVVNKEGKTIYTLKDGNFFGEIALFQDTPRTASVVAESYCDLYELNRGAFNDVLKRHPKISVEMEAIARDRQRSNA